MTPSSLWSAEPVAIVNAVRLCALAAMTFGLHLTDVQLGASMLALEAVLTIFTRSQVTSPASLAAMTPGTLQAAQDAPTPVKDTVKKLPVVILACVLALSAFGAMGCASVQPPPGTYSAQGQKTFNAVQFVKDLQALSDTAMNLNATTGRTHLSDLNTRYIRDFVLAALPAIQAYGQGSSSLGVVVRGFNGLVQSLSPDAKQNGTLAKVLAAVAAGVNSLPQ